MLAAPKADFSCSDSVLSCSASGKAELELSGSGSSSNDLNLEHDAKRIDSSDTSPTMVSNASAKSENEAVSSKRLLDDLRLHYLAAEKTMNVLGCENADLRGELDSERALRREFEDELRLWQLVIRSGRNFDGQDTEAGITTDKECNRGSEKQDSVVGQDVELSDDERKLEDERQRAEGSLGGICGLHSLVLNQQEASGSVQTGHELVHRVRPNLVVSWDSEILLVAFATFIILALLLCWLLFVVPAVALAILDRRISM